MGPGGADQIRDVDESPGSRDDPETGIRQYCQILRQVLVHMASRQRFFLLSIFLFCLLSCLNKKQKLL